jgi:predicted acylesterase/phospholipase RssA
MEEKLMLKVYKHQDIKQIKKGRTNMQPMQPNSISYPFTFTNMVISGGAMKTLSSIGCIRYLEEVNLIKYLRNFVGTSAGSILCLFIVLGYTSVEILDFVNEFLMKDEIVKLDINEMFQILSTFGLNSGANIERFVSEMLYRKIKMKDATFVDLAKDTGKNLVVCVANLTKETEEYWSVDTVPNMSVVKAVRASCSLPLVFTPMIHNGDIYIDGGIYNNFPIDYFNTSTLKDIIGINIAGNIDKKITDLMQYLTLVFHCAVKRLTKSYNNNLDRNVITLEFEDESWISFNDLKVKLNPDTFDNYVNSGYNKMKSLLNTLSSYHQDLSNTDK